MAAIKFTKIELMNLKRKAELFEKYLPTLRLKKAFFQLEVVRVKEEIRDLLEKYHAEKTVLSRHASLLTDPLSILIEKNLEIDRIITRSENIAGAIVPVLENVVFKEVDIDLKMTPIWMGDFIIMLRYVKQLFCKINVIRKKLDILERELRAVSIRVNLFEKRMIPQLYVAINQIEIFLGDQALQTMGQAKVAKRRLSSKVRDVQESYS